MTAKRDLYLKEIEKVSKELKRLLFEEKGWILKKNSKTCQVFRLPAPNGQDYVWKGEATIAVEAEKLYDMAHPTEKYRLLWDPNIVSCRVLEELTSNVIITHTVMKAHLLQLLSARDTIDVFNFEETDDYYSLQFAGIEYEAAPKPAPDVIRAWSYPSGIFIFKNKSDAQRANPATRVVTFINFDARLDVVPPAVLHAAMPTFQKKYFKSLQKTADIPWTPLENVPGRGELDEGVEAAE